jgi:glycosyltransferase involved in cell wall biosynthesis
MKIALVMPGFSASEIDWCIPALLNNVRLLAQRHNVHVYTLRYPHHHTPYQVYGANVYPFGAAQRDGYHRLRLIWQVQKAIWQEHQHSPFGAIHGFWADEPGVIAVRVGQKLGIPAVVSVMGGELARLPEIGYGHQLSGFMRQMVRYSLHRATWITVGSEGLQTQLKSTHSGKLHLVPLGVDTTLFYPQEHQTDTHFLRLISVGSLIPIKHHALLIEAIALVYPQAPNIHLKIVGEGPLAPQLQALIASYGLTAVVELTGAVSHDHLPNLYRVADVHVLPSYYESQSLVSLEAGACGCLPIGTKVGLLPELVGKMGLAIESTPQALAEVILHLYENPELRRVWAKQVQEKIMAKYGLVRQIHAWEGLYVV